MNLRVRLHIFVIILILILGFWLRVQDFAVWPRHGATFDEFAWTWLGVNLIQKGVPISWSRHPQYKDRQSIIYQGASFTLVKPYLEHPPMFGLVAGSFALLNGVSDMYNVTLQKIRPIAIGLGVLSIISVFLLVSEVYGKRLALISSLFYATIPTVVIGSRIVQNENFLIPFWLFSLYFLNKYLKMNKKIFRNIAILIAGLLPLAKVPWVVASFSLAFILAYKRKWRDVSITVIVTFILFLSFILYGIYYNKELFFNLWTFQLSRYDLTFTSFFSIFTHPLIVDREYLDGWIYFGFISLPFLALDFKRHNLVLFSFLAYFLVFLFAIPAEPGHGWYRYPFYPFLVISLAYFVKNYFTKNYFLTFLFLAFVGLPLFQATWVPSFGFSYVVLRILIIFFSISLVPVFFPTKKIESRVRVFSYILLMIVIALNIWAVLLYNEQ